MSVRRIASWIVLLAPAALAAAGEMPPEDVVAGPAGPPTVLVLRDGQVLRGHVSRAGDLYYVILPNGEIRVRGERVETACGSIEEAYQRRRATIRVGNVLDHLDLAEWCLREGLLDAASRELADATAADPSHRMIPYLARRVELARRPSPPEASSALATTAEPAGPSADELESLVRTMPSGTVRAFAMTIQPLLVGRCTEGGCHGPQSAGKLVLLRVHPGRSISNRMTQRNLYTVMQFVDRRHPEASPLLNSAACPRGAASMTALAERDSHEYRRLVEWVAALGTLPSGGGLREGLEEPPAGTRAAPVGGASPDSPPWQESPSVTGETDLAEAESPFDLPPLRACLPGPTRSTPKRGTLPAKFVPVDPFDPAIFNRRFSPTPPEPSASPPAGQPSSTEPPVVQQPADQPLSVRRPAGGP